MKKYYNVTFRWYNTDTYCANIAHAECKADVLSHYSEYEVVGISEVTEADVELAKRKGKPIVEC